MAKQQQEYFAERVIHFYQNVANGEVGKAVKHFSSEGHWPQSIRRIVRRFVERGTSKFRSKSSQPVSVATPDVIARVKRAYVKDPNVSERTVAAAEGISQRTVHRIKAKKLG